MKTACSVHIHWPQGWRNEMSDKIYDVPAEWSKRAWVDEAKYKEMYARSVSDPNGFWGEQAKCIGWMKPFTKVENASFEPGKISIKWFEDGVLNVAWNCIDRHLDKRGDQTAIIWEGDNPSESKHITYRQLHDEVCKMANILRTRNVKKGDRVTIYLPMIPEAAYAMLACARIGAIHSVVFAGFSPDSLAQRITDCQSKIVITADEGLRGGKKVPLKSNVDAAIAKSGDVGWVTGHSYILYGPLANGATTLMFEGVPNYPDNSRFWNVIDKHKVNIFYTAPTAIRALMQGGAV